jgi:hypothetical protein
MTKNLQPDSRPEKGEGEVSLKLGRQTDTGVYEVTTFVSGKVQHGKTVVITSPRKLAFPPRQKEPA